MIQFHDLNSTWVMRITADRMLEVNEDVHVTEAAKKVLEAMQGLLDAQPAQQEPLMDWVPVTQELLNAQPGWLYEPMWIAMKDGSVLQGHYEWRQGWNPDRLLTDGGDRWAFDSAYVMPMVKPTPPAEAKHGIKDTQ